MEKMKKSRWKFFQIILGKLFYFNGAMWFYLNEEDITMMTILITVAVACVAVLVVVVVVA